MFFLLDMSAFGIDKGYEAYAAQLFLFVLALRDACDANDDGNLNIADAVSLLDARFGVGNPLPAPGTCGSDPSSTDPLGYDSSSCP